MRSLWRFTNHWLKAMIPLVMVRNSSINIISNGIMNIINKLTHTGCLGPKHKLHTGHCNHRRRRRRRRRRRPHLRVGRGRREEDKWEKEEREEREERRKEEWLSFHSGCLPYCSCAVGLLPSGQS